MCNGRNEKIKPMGFETAATVLTSDLSPEAASNLTQMVRDVARQYGHSDSAMLKTARRRLQVASRRKKWAQEVLDAVSRKALITSILDGATAR